MARAQQIRERWHLARSILRYGGTGPFIRVISRGILRPLISWRIFCFFERNVAEPVAPFDAAIPLEIRIATDGDFDRFHEMLLRERVDENEIRRRRLSGDRCFVAVAQGRLIHFTWLMRGPVWLPALGAKLDLGADEAYAHYAYTDPAMRGRGVQPAVSNFMTRWERSAGIQRHYSFVMGHNVSGMKITSRHHVVGDSRPCRTVRTVRFLSARGFLSIGLRGEQRPHLEPGPHVDCGRFGLWIKP